jgi:hypothetical protein
MKRIKYIIEKDFVKVHLDGIVRAEEIGGLISDIVQEKENLPRLLKILIDSRRAKYEAKTSDLQIVLKKIIENHKKFEVIKLTIVQQNPFETAISMIMKEMLKGVENVYFEVFSTEQAAVSWLK